MKNILKTKNKYLNILILIILCTVIFLTIGYSALSSQLSIDDITAIVRVKKDIRITGISLANSNSNATSHWENYNVSNITSGISLPNNNSTVTYNIEVTNIGNMESSISEISGLPSNLKYTINNYSLKSMLCDNIDNTKCKLGSTTTLSITIGYATNGYNSNNTDYTINMNFTFSYMVDSIALMDDKLYSTLQEAINDVPTNNTEKTIVLLNNTSEVINIVKNKNINLDLNNRVLSNDGNTNVIKNYGTLKLSNGKITSNAATNGAINNESGGTMLISGGSVIVTGGRQALYNNKGIATITGSAYLTSSAKDRAAVQNVSGSTLNILGGIIISTGSSGVQNDSVMTIGVKDGNLDINYPVLQGVIYGINTTTNLQMYDGIAKGKTSSVNDITKIVELETGYSLINDEETISGTVYKRLYLGISNEVTFEPNGGKLTENKKYISPRNPIGVLPIPTRTKYEFDGWFTESGEQINTNTIINNDITFYAHWTKITQVAQIGNTTYDSVQEAINAVPDNLETTITLLKNYSEQITIEANKNIIFDLNNKTLSNLDDKSVVENSGNITFRNGIITSNANVGAINNNNGYLTITDNGQIIATGTRQAIYITGGTVEITSNAYLSSQTSGTPTNTTMERGTVQCLSGGNLIITGGTIEGLKQQAVSNEGILTIGTKDGNINTTTPILIGNAYGVKTVGTFNLYDGIIKGKTNAINGTITEQETNSELITGTEKINGTTYKTVSLRTTE